MKERFVVDFKIAAAERNSLLTPDWRWPVAAEQYDDPLREFVEWAYTLPAELSHDEDLRIAFELIESDLLKDIASIFGTWIDVSTAHQQDLDLIYGDRQLLYKMLDQDQFEQYSPTQQTRVAVERASQSRSRKTVRFVRDIIKRFRSVLRSPSVSYLVGGNPLTAELTGSSAQRIRHTYADLIAQRESSFSATGNLVDLANTIHSNLLAKLESIGHPATKNFAAFIGQVISNYLVSGWQDKDFRPEVTPNSTMTLHTGTGGGYLARVICNAFSRAGAEVIRTTHGGDTVLFDDPLWPSTELPFASTYAAYGPAAAKQVGAIVERHKSLRNEKISISVTANGSQLHSRILNRSKPATSIQNVYVVSASFSGLHRAIPNMKIHDVVYYEWHRRLLAMVKSAGFNVVAKRHPKGLDPDLELFADVASEELRLAGMADTFDQADAYVLDIAGSAFMEAACTLKPIVLIDIPNRQMTDDARKRIGESVQIIRASFDANNRVMIDSERIKEAITAPVNLDARKRFIADYLTSNSS